MHMVWLLMLFVTLVTSQDPQGSSNDRGTMVMGFDQEKTAHHFYLYADGGAIDIAVRDSADTQDRDAIRSHLPHIATMFASGNFEAPMLVHDRAHVPGTAVLKQKADTIRYRYEDTQAGGRVDIVTADRNALSAVHEFLRYQITEHQTHDPLTVGTRP